MSMLLYRLLWSLFAAVATLYCGINLGLRLMPAGRRFLARARAEGRLLAGPRAGAGAAVWAVFALAWAAAPAAGLFTYVLLGGRL